jgi:uncharacterized protein (TIGR01244 family)
MRRYEIPLAAAVLLAAASVTAGVPETVDASQIPAYKRIDPDLVTAGQPTPEAITQLKALGFHTVVNLRTDAEGAREEKTAVEALGLRYVHVPVTPESFSAADVEAVEKVLADPTAGPVLLHCHSSNRVGAVWAAIQARRGHSFDEALAGGREAGLKSPAMIGALRGVLGLPAEAGAGAPAVKP